MIKYIIVIEKTVVGYSAYCPDLAGCVATGQTIAELQHTMREAIEFHLEGLRLEGYLLPQPQADSAFVEVAA